MPVVSASVGGGRFVPLPGEWILFDSQLAHGLHVPEGRRLFATDGNHGTVNVFDLALLELEQVLHVGGKPHAIVRRPNSDQAYVADRANDSIRVLDTSMLTLVPSSMPVGDDPYAIVFSDDGSTAYVANRADDPNGVPSISVIDAVQRIVTRTISFDHLSVVRAEQLPTALDLSRDGRSLYVLHTGRNYDFDEDERAPGRQVSVITFDAAGPNASVLDKRAVQVDDAPVGLLLLGDGDQPEKVYVVCNRTSNDAGVVHVLGPDLSAITTIETAPSPAAILLDPARMRAYVSHLELDTNVPSETGVLSVIDLATDTPVGAPIDVGVASASLALDSAGTRLFVGAWDLRNLQDRSSVRWVELATIGTGAVTITDVDLDIRQPVRSLLFGPREGFAVHPSSLSVFDPEQGALVANVPARGPGPLQLAWVAGDAGGAWPDRLYATLPGLDRIGGLDLDTLLPVAPPATPSGGHPARLVWSENTGVLWATMPGRYDSIGDRVFALDVERLDPLEIGSFDVPEGPAALALTGDGSRLFAAGFGDLHFGTSAYDDSFPGTLADTTQPPPGQLFSLRDEVYGTSDVALTHGGEFVCFTSYLGSDNGDGFVAQPFGSVLVGRPDLASFDHAILDLASGQRPMAIAIRHDDQRAYALGHDSDSASVIDLSDALDFDDPAFAFVAGVIPLGDGPRALRLARDSADLRVFVPCFEADELWIIEADESTTSYPVGDGPIDVVVTGSGSSTRAWVCNYLDGTVSVVDPAGVEATQTLDAGRGPIHAIADANGATVFVANSLDASVTILDAASARSGAASPVTIPLR
jgi:DNA-binding beta-propeller fold protein YncE